MLSSVRERLARERRRRLLVWGARELRRQSTSQQALHLLHRGWGNQGYSADIPYLAEVLARGRAHRGPILECGSGLTTIALAASGADVWALEHELLWKHRVDEALATVGARAHVLGAPLTAYDDIEWYSVPDELPDRFSLVVCDGPPRHTKGGRSGLWKVVGPRISNATVLLDDARRPETIELLHSLSREGWKVRASTAGRAAVVEPPT